MKDSKAQVEEFHSTESPQLSEVLRMESGLIYKKLIEVMRAVKSVGKNGTNQMQKYKFRSIEDICNMLHPLIKEQGIFIVPEAIETQTLERKTKNGGLSLHRLMKIKYTFLAEDGSFVSSVMSGEAMDSGDKATQKCMAYALKYTLAQMFLIPTDDPDPDNYTHSIQAPFSQSSRAARASTSKNKPVETKGVISHEFIISAKNALEIENEDMPKIIESAIGRPSKLGSVVKPEELANILKTMMIDTSIKASADVSASQWLKDMKCNGDFSLFVQKVEAGEYGLKHIVNFKGNLKKIDSEPQAKPDQSNNKGEKGAPF